MKKRILLLGPGIQKAAGGMAPCRRPGAEWEVLLAQSGAQALAYLSTKPVDAVVADAELPGADAARFLDEVVRRCPRSLRFIYGPPTASPGAMRCLGRAYQLLASPADTRSISRALDHAFSMRFWLPDNDAQQLVSTFDRLPSPPEPYFKVVQALESPETTITDVGELIAADPAMSAKVLQLANSALLGLSQPVADVADAVLYIGVETTKALVLLAHSFSYFDDIEPGIFSMDQLWRHSIQVGSFSRMIAAVQEGETSMPTQAFTAGLLHDLGKALLAANRPRELAEIMTLVRAHQLPVERAERQVVGATHADVGAWLLGIWGLPTQIVEAVALHHLPVNLSTDGFCPLTAVHAANVIAHQASTANNGHPHGPVDMDYLEHLGLGDRFEHWRTLCLDRETSTAFCQA